MTLAEAQAIVDKVDGAIGTHGLPWVEKNWLKKGTKEYAVQASKLGRARSIVAASKVPDPVIGV